MAESVRTGSGKTPRQWLGGFPRDVAARIHMGDSLPDEHPGGAIELLDDAGHW